VKKCARERERSSFVSKTIGLNTLNNELSIFSLFLFLRRREEKSSSIMGKVSRASEKEEEEEEEETSSSSSRRRVLLSKIVERNAQLEKKMSEILTRRKRTDDEKDEDDTDDEFISLEFLERQRREQEESAFISFSGVTSSSSSSSSLSSSNSKEEEENVLVVDVFVESSLRLVNVQLRFLKFLMKEDQEDNQVQKHRSRIRTREMTLIAHAIGSVVLNVGRVVSSTNANFSSVLIQTQTTTTIKTNSNHRGEEEDEGIVVVADIESVSTLLAKEVLADAVATLKKHGGEEESSIDESDGGGKRLEEKQWYAACVVRAIKACATLTSWPEREMDALVNVLLRECAFYKYEGCARRGEVDDGNGETKVSEDSYIGGFAEESDWCLPPSSAFEKAGKAKTTITEVSPVELLKTEALAALGYMAKRNPSGMCSRWQIVFPREFSPAPKKKKSSVLLASQKTLEKLMVFERSASVRSAACFAIISLLDSSEAKKYLAMAEMKEDKGVSGGSAVSAMSSSSSRRASSGFSTVSMNLGENAVALCETISYAWTRISEHHFRKRFPGAPTPSKDNIGSADKWISWLSILTEKAVDSLPFLRLPKRLVPQLANSIKCALLIEYSSFPSSAVVSAFFKEAPIIRCLGITLSAKIGFESLESNASSVVFKSSLNARKYTADEMTLFLQACEALWKKAAASTTRDSLIDKEVQESCEAFKALQKLASSENASKILFPNRECVCKLSPDVLMAIFVAKSSSRANKVAFEKVMHASVKLQCAMLSAVLQKSRRKNSSFLFCAEIRRELWCNFIDNALPSCLSNTRSDEVTQLVKIAALRCLSETTDCVISDIRSSSNGTAEISRIKAVFEAPLDILREKHRRYPSATRAEAMRTLASLLILDPKYFEMNEVLLGALESVKNAMNQERTHQDFSKTLEMNASLCAANIALCATRLPTPSADDSDDVSINKELTHLFHEWTISKADKVRANVARGLGHIAKFRDLEDETLQLICEALFSCASTGSAKTQWNSCVAIKNLFENQDAISNEAFSAVRGVSNAGVILTRLLLTLIKTSENFKIRRESLAAISRASRTFLDHLSYVDCIRVVVEALVQSEKQCSKLVGEFEDDDGNVTSKRAAEKYREELKAQAISTFVHLLSIGVVSERGCTRIVREHSSHALEAIRIAVDIVETGGSEGDGDRFESATKFDKETVSTAQTVLSEMLGVPVTVPRPAVFEKVLLAKNENVLSSKHMHK